MLALSTLLLGLASSAWAADGVVLINQSKAEAGNVTPGDAPGFPVTISESGSYRLSGNLTVPDANTTAISTTRNVVLHMTLDLNGFAIRGVTVCAGEPLTCSPTGSGSTDAKNPIAGCGPNTRPFGEYAHAIGG